MSDSCKNCLYFRPHYAKDDNNIYYDLNTGHCTNEIMRKLPAKRCFKSGRPCNYWQINEEAKPAIDKADIIEAIFKTASLVEKIAEHLKIE